MFFSKLFNLSKVLSCEDINKNMCADRLSNTYDALGPKVFQREKNIYLGLVSKYNRKHINVMRYLIFLVPLLAANTALASNWTHVGANHHASYFVDVDSIEKDGDYINFWEMGNLFGPIGDGILSIKSYNQADCKKFLLKTLKTSFHKKPMASDKFTAQASAKVGWKRPPRKSASAKILKFVCER